jgi:hypothetical protein
MSRPAIQIRIVKAIQNSRNSATVCLSQVILAVAARALHLWRRLIKAMFSRGFAPVALLPRRSSKKEIHDRNTRLAIADFPLPIPSMGRGSG